MLLLIILLFISLCGLFIFFFMKYQEIDKEFDELYDLYYELTNYSPKNDKTCKITVLNRKEVK